MFYRIKGKIVKFDLDFTPPARPYLTSNGYAAIGGKYAHRLVLSAPWDLQVDHINHDKLDNRTANLRLCSEYHNNKNRPEDVRNTSGYIGVYRVTSGWVANIHFEGRTIYIKTFSNPVEAAVARDSVAQQLFGQYANLNFKEL